MGSGARTGDFWAWFGGIDQFEEGRLSQSFDLPEVSRATLSFWLETPSCSGSAGDFLEVLINGNQEFIVRGDDPLCGTIGYREVTIDLTSHSGQTVNLEFHSIVQGGGISNFFVDDIDVQIVPLTIFDDGFESGDTSAWSNTVP